jgi:hypothetical protein
MKAIKYPCLLAVAFGVVLLILAGCLSIEHLLYALLGVAMGLVLLLGTSHDEPGPRRDISRGR